MPVSAAAQDDVRGAKHGYPVHQLLSMSGRQHAVDYGLELHVQRPLPNV